MSQFVDDSDGQAWEYRLVSSRLERRRISSSVWLHVQDGDFTTMTPTELRHIADVLERRVIANG